MIVRGIAAAMGISAAAIIGAALTPAWAETETVKVAAMFDSDGALDASSLGDVRTGVAPAPGGNDEEEVRRKRPGSSDADPLSANRGSDPRSENRLSSPFTANLILDGSPVNQQPAQNPPATTNPPPVTNNPPVTSNPPAASNPPPAQNTIPIANNSPVTNIVNGATANIGSSITTVLRRDGLIQ